MGWERDRVRMEKEEDGSRYVPIGQRCPECCGSGRAYDPKDRDVYEGYKLAEKKICNRCCGTGKVR